MASNLLHTISSDDLATENALQPKTAPNKVLVYVESDEDISFWRSILKDYETANIEFEILTPTKKGKQKAIEKSKDILDLKTGQYLIVCVDSDYDYLLREQTDQSKLINTNPYIFQTYSYSIENLQCFSESLHHVCVQSTKHDKKLVNFNDLLIAFSNTIYQLFLWNLYFRKNNDHKTFTISDFCDIIKLENVDVTDQFSVAFADLKTRVDTKVTSLSDAHPLIQEKIDSLEANFVKLGLNENHTYLFIQGHTLKDNVVLMMLKPVCHILIKEKEEQIKHRHTIDQQQLINEMGQYRNQKQDISLAIDLNTEFKNCFLFKKIKADIDKYMASFS